MKNNDIIVNIKNPEYGEWKVRESDIEGMWEITSDRGSRMLNKDEEKFWRIIEK